MSLLTKSAAGFLWNSIDIFLQRGMTILTTLVLTYFLVPEDFGLLAMIAIFLALGTTLMDSGFRQALIRLKTVEDVDFNTAFAANVFLGIVAYLVLFTASPYIADFYDEPRLELIVRVMSLSILLQSVQVVYLAKLTRALNFKAQLKATGPANLLSGLIAIALAVLLNWGVWALVSQVILMALIQTVLLVYLGNWRPTANFSLESLKSMYGFGYKLFLASTLDTVFKNLYVAVVAKLFSASMAGHFYLANKLKHVIVTQIVSVAQTVTFPAFATIQDDNVRLKSAYKRVMAVTIFVLYPILLFLVVLCPLIFSLFLPADWMQAAYFLQFMLVAGLMYPLHSINLNILKVKGRSDLFLHIEIIKKVIVAITLLVSINYGVYGILIGQIVSSIISYIPNGYFSSKLIDYPFREQVSDVMPTIFCAGFASALGWVIIYGVGFGGYLGLCFSLAIMLFLYFFVSYFFKVAGFVEILSIARSKFRGFGRGAR